LKVGKSIDYYYVDGGIGLDDNTKPSDRKLIFVNYKHEHFTDTDTDCASLRLRRSHLS
jgi:hypothetical protein